MTIALHIGDCRTVLATLPAASVHCVVTSPPYWGLRDYGTATWQGGDPACDHTRQSSVSRASSGLNGATITQGGVYAWGGACGKCGAVRIDAQLGLEPDFNAYVANMVAVFREVRRVLRDDGTLWLNLGDSYSSHDPGGYREGEFLNPDGRPPAKGQARNRAGNHTDLPRKNLIGIPWRVAFALQADGWYLRQDIIWSKPNPMPESVTDRCTKAHEYLFLLSKRERYYYDADAIAEPNAEVDRPQSEARRAQRLSRQVAPVNGGGQSSKGIDDGWVAPSHVMQTGATRNKRSVWEVTTQPFSEAHFATFPPALIEPCIKAGTSEKGCCAKCGKPWMRQVSKASGGTIGTQCDHSRDIVSGRSGQAKVGQKAWDSYQPSQTISWSPSCACAANAVPCTVLDPFAGAGTTGLVADRLQRNAILIELNPAYAAMSSNRIKDDAPLFVEMAT